MRSYSLYFFSVFSLGTRIVRVAPPFFSQVCRALASQYEMGRLTQSLGFFYSRSTRRVAVNPDAYIRCYSTGSIDGETL